jgi:hypothetical protein
MNSLMRKNDMSVLVDVRAALAAGTQGIVPPTE